MDDGPLVLSLSAGWSDRVCAGILLTVACSKGYHVFELQQGDYWAD